MNSKVLLVGAPSDELRRSLSGEFWIQSSASAPDALQLLPSSECAAVICCLDEQGAALRFLEEVHRERPNLPGILLAAEDWNFENVAGRVTTLLVMPAAANPEMVRLNTRQIIAEQARRTDQKQLLERSATGSVSALFEIQSIVDPYSASLGQRLRYTIDLFCKAANLQLTWEMETAALLANVGVLTVPVRVLMKHQSGQEMSPFEKEMISRLPERGADLLQQMPLFAGVAPIIRYQAKNFDGSGTPADGMADARLPLGSRILKVVTDLFRLKENGKSQAEAMEEMEDREGRYDPAILKAAGECFDFNLPSKISGSTVPLSVRDLRPGQLLVTQIETDDGVLLIRDGQVISPRLLHKLRNFVFTSGVKEPIYVIDLLESRKMTTAFSDIANGGTTFFARGR